MRPRHRRIRIERIADELKGSLDGLLRHIKRPFEGIVGPLQTPSVVSHVLLPQSPRGDYRRSHLFRNSVSNRSGHDDLGFRDAFWDKFREVVLNVASDSFVEVDVVSFLAVDTVLFDDPYSRKDLAAQPQSRSEPGTYP